MTTICDNYDLSHSLLDRPLCGEAAVPGDWLSVSSNSIRQRLRLQRRV